MGTAELVKGYAGVYVLSLGKFELATNAYTSPTEKFYRIQANLSQNVDLRHYLFDEHLLTLEIEDKRGTVDKFVYVVDKKNCGGAWPVGKQRSTPTITKFTGRPTPGLFSVCAFKG